MTLGMPSITITFKQLAASAMARSARGILAIVVRDDTTGDAIASYASALDIPANAYTADNKKIIERAFISAPSKVYVVKWGTEATATDLKALLDSIKFNWLVCADSTAQASIVSYVQAKNNASDGHKVKTVVYNVATADDMHSVNFTTESAKIDGETVTGVNLLSRIGGILAGLSMARSATYYALDEIESVVEPADLDAAVDAGKLFLFNDEGTVKIARAVNSMTTVGANQTEDMKSIAIVEAMDLIQEDIYNEFKNNYIGKYKNSYDNQCLFIAAVNGYFKDLQQEQVLDPNYNNIAGVDIEAQRNAWIASGKSEAVDWDELTVKNNSFKRKVFLAGKVKILDAMEDLVFPITMA